MWSKRITLAAALAAFAVPAAAAYVHAPFHDRPFEVADLALRVLDGETVAVPADDVPLAAAVAAILLLSERGVAETYEEAVAGESDQDDPSVQNGDGDSDGDGEREGDGDPYRAAHALLQTVRPWVAAVPQDEEIADLMERLDRLMPTAERPAALDADPEAGEVLAQALVGRLEQAADADLYLGRDLGRAMETVSQLAAHGCAIDEPVRPRWFEIAAFYYEDALEAPLAVLAAEPAERIETGMEALAEGDLSVCDDVGNAFITAKRRLFP